MSKYFRVDIDLVPGAVVPLAAHRFLTVLRLGVGDTVVLCTATMARQPRPNMDFFPLTIDFEEKMYAAGKIPGSSPLSPAMAAGPCTLWDPASLQGMAALPPSMWISSGTAPLTSPMDWQT